MLPRRIISLLAALAAFAAAAPASGRPDSRPRPPPPPRTRSDAPVALRFNKATTDSDTASEITFPITARTVDSLSPTANAVSMRVFGQGQLAGTSWNDVLDWIKPVSRPVHADSAAPADAASFWAEFGQVAEMQRLRTRVLCSDVDPLTDTTCGAPVMARDLLQHTPAMFQNHTLEMAASEVERDFPSRFPSMLAEQFLGSAEGVKFDDTVVPRVGSDFVNSEVMLARLVGWAVSAVSPTAFASKWHEGRCRPEEVAWLIAQNDAKVAGMVPADVRADIEALGLTDMYSFTAYKTGSPRHPSWPAMHSAASSASLYFAVVLDLSPSQLQEAIALDCAVATFRTFAGVHYASDNVAGLSIGQEVLRRQLPGFLQTNYGSDPAKVTAKIDAVIAAHDWRTAGSGACYN